MIPSRDPRPEDLAGHTHAVPPPPADPGRRHARRGWLVVTLLVTLGIATLTASALLARNALTQAEAELGSLRADIANGHVQDTAAKLDAIQSRTRLARRLLNGPVWRLTQHAPYLGRSVRLLRGLSDAVDASSHRELASVVRVAESVAPASLRRPDGSLDLERLAAAAPSLHQVEAGLIARKQQVQGLPNSGVPGVLLAAKSRLLGQLNESVRQIRPAVQFATLAPPMLGAAGTRRYFVGLQNNAELRGAGGNVGNYAVVTARHGRIRIERVAGADFIIQPQPVANFGSAYTNLYGPEPATSLLVSNKSPHFPYAGRLWTALWHAQSGQKVDGAVAIDAVGLSYLMRASGPVATSDGRTVSAANVVDFLLREEYETFRGVDAAQRKEYLHDIFRSVFDRLLSPRVSVTSLAREMGLAADERHLLVYSSVPAEEAELTKLPLGGALPPSSGIAFTLNNVTGGKMDYYLRLTSSYVIQCTSGLASATATFVLANTAPRSGLPPYPLLRADVPPGTTPPGQQRWEARLYIPSGAYLRRLVLDDKLIPSTLGQELGHNVYGIDISVNPGTQHTLRYELSPVPPDQHAVILPATAHQPVTSASTSGCR